MRIELVMPSLEIGGMERMVVSLACGLSERGHDVGVTCLNALGVLRDELQASGIRTSLVRAPTILSNVVAPALIAHFKALRLDVVHTQSGAWGRAVRAAKHAGVSRTIHTVHGRLDVDPWYDVALKRWEVRHTDHIVAVSDALADDLKQRIGVASSKVSVLINGIDTTVFMPDSNARARSRSTFGLGEAVVFGTVARLVPVKNQAVLIDAFGEVQRAIPNATLIFVGDGPLETELRDRAVRSPASDRIRFLGMQSDTASIYRALDFFVLPSLAEGTSMSLLEAMASGVPCIATPVGGNPHLLDGGRCGTLAAECSAGAIRDAMLAAAAPASDSSAFAQRARARVVETFSRDSMLDDYEDLYHTGP